MGIKYNVINALYSPPIRWVNLKFGNRMISPICFYVVAQLIEKDRIHCDVDAKMQQGAEAIYNPITDTIVAPYASYGEAYWDEKSALVHESTHAFLDACNGADMNGQTGNTMTVLDDETIAYLAGAMYLVAAGVGSSKPGVNQVAIKTVKRKMDTSKAWTGTETIEFSRQDVAALQEAIKADPLYANHESHSHHDGLKAGLENLW